MTTSRRNHLTTDSIRSPFITERRRKLFPTDDHDMDSDLGHISPIHSDDPGSDSEVAEKVVELPQIPVHGCDTPMSNKTYSDTMSPLKLSPCTGKFLNETPRKSSPTRNFKTPHDTSTRPVLEKEQKTLLEESKSMKRKCSPGSSPESSNKCLKSDVKSSKVRTALFPPESTLDMSLSTKSFYSKNQAIVLDKPNSHRAKSSYKPIQFSTTKHSTHRKLRKIGQINNGVRHKIRKPKQKKISKAALAKATKKMLETGAVLTEYIQDLTELKNKQNLERRLIQQPDSIIENPEPNALAPEENKENIESASPDNKSKTPRKFFKSSRAPTGNKNKPLPIENEPKKFVLPTVEPRAPENIILDSTNDFQEDDTEPEANIENILSTLSSETTNGGDIYQEAVPYMPSLDAPNSVQRQPNLADSLEASNALANVANSILSPISQMCDVTSGLALNSPRKGRDLTRLLSNMSSRAAKILSFNSDCHSVDMDEQKKKLFPIFYKGQPQDNADRGEKRPRADAAKRSAKRFKGLPPDQMLLDAGQKKFGLTLCNECNIVYHMGDPNDEIQHMNYHNAHHVLRFAGWRNERVVADFHAKGRIIKVLPTDSKIWIKKVKDLMEVVLRDLGCYEMEYDISQSQVYLYIKNRTIAGCVAATVPKEKGHKMLSTLSGVAICSEEAYPIKCGISHVWVAANFRQQGVASALLDVVKRNFILGEILTNDDIALTSPTEAGSAFAEKYFKTPNYLIYYT